MRRSGDSPFGLDRASPLPPPADSSLCRACLTRFEYLPLQNRKLSKDEVQSVSVARLLDTLAHVLTRTRPFADVRRLRQAERAVRAFLARDYSTSSFGSRSSRDIKAELRAMLEAPTEGDANDGG